MEKETNPWKIVFNKDQIPNFINGGILVLLIIHAGLFREQSDSMKTALVDARIANDATKEYFVTSERPFILLGNAAPQIDVPFRKHSTILFPFRNVGKGQAINVHVLFSYGIGKGIFNSFKTESIPVFRDAEEWGPISIGPGMERNARFHFDSLPNWMKSADTCYFKLSAHYNGYTDKQPKGFETYGYFEVKQSLNREIVTIRDSTW